MDNGWWILVTVESGQNGELFAFTAKYLRQKNMQCNQRLLVSDWLQIPFGALKGSRGTSFFLIDYLSKGFFHDKYYKLTAVFRCFKLINCNCLKPPLAVSFLTSESKLLWGVAPSEPPYIFFAFQFNSIQFICIAQFHKLQICLGVLYNLYT